ncbi:hypothetical protein BvCmsL71A_00301 [Escherichia coli]|nr:hypothetical protein BvCmsL71A_00301 [Escherichia coli]
MRAAGLQIDGHADHVAATWFGIAYQSLKFQIGIFSDALVLHADIQAKRARCFSGLPPLNNADQESERFHHPPHGTGGSFMLMNIKSILHYLAFDAFCPALVPAIHRERPGEIRQEADRTGSRIPQVTQRHLQIRNPATGLRQSALQ